MKKSFHIVRPGAAALTVLIGCGGLAAPASAQRSAPVQAEGVPSPATQANRVFEVRRAAGEMKVDARLDEPAWSDADPIPLPIEIGPRDNVATDVETSCRVTFDESNVYLGCVALDPDPAGIRAFVTNRDGIFGNNDRISFLLDPFNDSRRGFVFEVSPLGVQADLVYNEQASGFDSSWDGIWDSAGRITEDGYVIEAAIPFRTLRFPAGAGVQSWRFWIYRMRPRDEFVILSTNTRLRGDVCRLCQAHVLRGFVGMDPGLNVELVPTLTARRSDSRAATFPEGPLVSGAPEWDPGLDARWSISTNMALNATLNPDFSQVEADAAQLDVNNRFALRFPEKRPFFLEGADLFETPIEAVFTRTITDPSVGAKLTGKAGLHAAGALAAVDEANTLLFPGPSGSRGTTVDERVTTALLRYRRDLGESGTIGGIYTGRFGEGDYHNQLGGLDLFVRPLPNVRWTVQALASGTRYDPEIAAGFDQPAGSFTGHALFNRVQLRTEKWSANAGIELQSRDFRADAGFVPRTDVRSTYLNGSYTHYGEGRLLRRLQTILATWRDDQPGAGMLGEGAWINLVYEGPLQSNLWLNPGLSRESFAGETYDVSGWVAGASLAPAGWLTLGVRGRVGNEIDFRNGGVGGVVRLSPFAEARVGRRIELAGRQSYQRMEKGGAEVFTAHVGELKGVYNFSARAFVRGLFQYRRTDRSPAMNPGLEQPLQEALFSQLLFSYKLNPLSVVFLGFTDDRAGFESLDEGHRGRVELTPRGRTFFLKLGYAWRP